MGKHGKSKSSKGAGIQARPAPYTKKPRVEVTYEGGAKDSRLPTSASSSATPAASKAVSVGQPAPSSKVKGKAKAVDSTTASPVDTDVTDVTDVKPDIIPADHLPPFLVIAGSYEKLLYGLQGSFGPSASEDDQPQATLTPTFIFPAHLACVKAIAASPGGKWLATGSEDEFVKVWDLRRKKEVGSLSQHSGECGDIQVTPNQVKSTSTSPGLLGPWCAHNAHNVPMSNVDKTDD
jgi:protein MAK11